MSKDRKDPILNDETDWVFSDLKNIFNIDKERATAKVVQRVYESLLGQKKFKLCTCSVCSPLAFPVLLKKHLEVSDSLQNEHARYLQRFKGAQVFKMRASELAEDANSWKASFIKQPPLDREGESEAIFTQMKNYLIN